MLTERTAKGKQSNEYMGYITLQCTLIPKTQDEKEQVIISKNLTVYILQSNGADMCIDLLDISRPWDYILTMDPLFFHPATQPYQIREIYRN